MSTADWWQNLFRLENFGENTFRAPPVDSPLPRVYGGQIAAQTMLAAAATVAADRTPHSLRISFLRAGDTAAAVTYEVDRVRDSRSMATRIVTARQSGPTLATAVVSFHRAPPPDTPPPIEHEWAAGDTESSRCVPSPEGLPSRRKSLAQRYGDDVPPEVIGDWPVDMRYIDHIPWNDSIGEPRNRLWIRASEYPRADACADAAAVVFATDLPMFEPVYFPIGAPWQDVVGHRVLLGSSLDHSVWFHRPVRADEWLLFDQLAPVAHHYRAFCRGELRSRAGHLVASVAQEMVFVAPLKPRDGRP